MKWLLVLTLIVISCSERVWATNALAEKNCETVAPFAAKAAEIYGKAVQEMLETTQPNSAARTKRLKEIIEHNDKILDDISVEQIEFAKEWTAHANVRLRGDVNDDVSRKLNYINGKISGASFYSPYRLAVDFSMSHPGQTAARYRRLIYEECVSRWR